MILEFLPEHATWEEWNGNLVHYFGDQQFPVVPETMWKEVANAVCLNPVFSDFIPPTPDIFDHWQDWAKVLTVNVNGA